MPLTLQQKKELLASKGYNPQQYDFDESTGDVFERSEPLLEEPVLNVNPAVAPKSSTFGAVARGAAQSALPSLTAIGAGALAPQVLPFAHVAPPYSEIVAGLIGAVGAGFGASKAQEALVPPAVKEKLFLRPEDIQEHPIASNVGEFLPSALAFNPVKSVEALGRGAKGVGTILFNPVGQKALSSAEIAGLKNLALNAGVNVGTQAGLNIAQQLQSEQPFSYGSLAKDAALGLLFNEPTRLGQRYLGFRPSFEGIPTTTELLARNQELGYGRLPGTQRIPVSPEQIEPPFYNPVESRIQELRNIEQQPRPLTERSLDRLERETYGLPELKLREEPRLMERAVERMEAEGGPALREEDRPLPIEEEIAVQGAVNVGKIKYLEDQARKFEAAIQNLKTKEQESAAIQSFNALEPEIQKLLAKRGVRIGQYRVEIKGPKGEVVLGQEGKPIAGQSEYTQRRVSFGREAGADTAFHEAGHIYLEDLARSLDPKDRELVSKAFSELGRPDLTAEEFVRLNEASRQGDASAQEKFIKAEEELMDYLGLEGAKRKLQGSSGKQYFKDYLSRFSLGEKPARQQLSARLEHEAPYGSRTELLPQAQPEIKVGSTKQQDESQMSGPEFLEYAKSLASTEKGGMTYAAKKKGLEAKSLEEIESFKKEEEKSAQDFARLVSEGKLDEATGLAYKKQFFNEAYQAATGEGGIGASLRKEQKGYVPPIQRISQEYATTKKQIEGSIPAQSEKGISGGQKAKTSPSDSIQRPKEQEQSKIIEGMDLQLRTALTQKRRETEKATKENRARKEADKISNKAREIEEKIQKDFDLNDSDSYLFLERADQGLNEYNEMVALYGKTETDEILINYENLLKDYRDDYEQYRKETRPFYEAASKKEEELEAFVRPDKEKNQEASQITPKELERKPLLNVFTSVTDKIKAGKPDKSHTLVSDSLKAYFNERDFNIGRYGNSIADLYSKFSPQEVANHYKRRWEIDNGLKPSLELSPRERELDTQFQELIQRPKEDAAQLGLKVKRGETYAVGGIKPEGYLYNIFDPKVLYEFENNPNGVEAKRNRRLWEEWLTKKGADRPEEIISSWEAARREYGDTGGPEFAALRKAEGFGLPWELMDKNPGRAAMRYARRAAADLAWFKHIQSSPDVRYALGIKDQEGKLPEKVEGLDFLGSEKDVQKALQFVYGKTSSDYPRIEAFSRLVGNMVMGPGTAIRNLASIPAQLAPYDVGMKDILKGIGHIGSARKRAFETNAVRANPSEFEKLGDIDNPDKVVASLNKLSDFFRKWQGRNLSDKWEGELLYAIGEQWTKTKLIEAKAGDKRALDLLQRVSGGITSTEALSKPTDNDIAKFAKGFVNIVRGTYGPQGLPAWALTGNIAPFVALNRYSIEKWNNVYKDIVVPAKQGSYGPLLKYTLTALGTGAGIEQLNELLSGRKGPDLNLKETAAAWHETGDPQLLASKAIGLAQLAAYAGIVGDMAKLGVRLSEGKSVAYSNPLSYPAYTFVTETIAQNLGEVTQALKQGEDPFDVLSEFVRTVGVQSIQAARYINARVQSTETQRKEEFADIRKYREATGKAQPEVPSGVNEFEGLAQKKFKRTEDLGEVAEQLPELIQRAFEKAGNDPYRLKSELRKLKQNSNQIFPSPENQPIEFYQYLAYLRQTQGEEVAAERLAKFLRTRAINKVKASIVP